MNEQEALSAVISILEEMTQDWELDLEGPIDAQTRLMEDLAFESIDIVQLAVSIEQKFNRKNLPFEKLFMRDGDYVDELAVSEIAGFVAEQID